jgi:hypothetical protein
MAVVNCYYRSSIFIYINQKHFDSLKIPFFDLKFPFQLNRYSNFRPFEFRTMLQSISPTVYSFSLFMFLQINTYLYLTYHTETYQKILNSILLWKYRHVPHLGYRNRTDNY